MKKKLHVYMGTFTDHFYSAYIDVDTLEVEDLHAIYNPGGRSATLALSANGKYLYTANEFMDGDGGMAAFRLVEGGDPVFLNAIASNTQGPAENTTMVAYGKEYVLGTGYFDGDVMVCPIAEDGSLLPMCDNFILDKAAKAHGVQVCPGTNFLMLPDTENNVLYTFEMSPEGKLIKRFAYKEEGLEAPRHTVFSEDGKRLYLLTERTSTFEVFDVNKETGELTHTAHFSNLPDDFTGASRSAAIHCSPDGKFVYLSNRGHNSITVYRIEDDGKVSKVGYQGETIKWPREFMITPDGSVMIVGNQEASSISFFRINRETGMPVYAKTLQMPVPPVSFIVAPEAED